jgi:hypothetical protein
MCLNDYIAAQRTHNAANCFESGYILARTYIHALTGVDPNNFNATLLLFTSITAGFLLAVVHGILGCINDSAPLHVGFGNGWSRG